MPEKIGQYTLVSRLGEGGMGVVYKARDETLDRFVAIKLVAERLASGAELVDRFLREAQAAGRLSHPNIIQIFEFRKDGGRPYFVMEFVDGRSLDLLIRECGRVENPLAAQLVLQTARGLSAAHEAGIIHRDIKPANLILDRRGTVKVADFGLARLTEASHRLTATGDLWGTLSYLAPEQCRDEDADRRTDIYALGVTYFELLSGVPPFQARNSLALFEKIVREEPPNICSINSAVDATSSGILKRMMAKNREDRYQDCDELISDLEDYTAKLGVRSVTNGLENSAIGFVAAQDRPALPTPEHGSAEAQYILGVEAEHMKFDEAEAVKWYRLAADRGHAEAQTQVGIRHLGTEEALHWFRGAAAQDHDEAQFYLGVIFHWGLGVARDLLQAVKWYQLAAEQGHAWAQLMLGSMYEVVPPHLRTGEAHSGTVLHLPERDSP